MAYFHQGELRQFSTTRESNILNEARERTRMFSAVAIRSGMGPMAFISHKHSDLNSKELQGLLYLLENKYKVITYIDSKDKKMPDVTCAETADRIKSVISNSNRFILLATEDAIRSMWCNWEVGIADKTHYFDHTMAVLPLLDKQQTDSSFIGNEYLQLYPRIVLGGFGSSNEIMARCPDNKYAYTLGAWLGN